MHDAIASDKRNPTVNPNGPVYGATEASTEYMPVIDPRTHTASTVKLQVRLSFSPATGATVSRAGTATVRRKRR